MRTLTPLIAITIFLVGCSPDDQPTTETNDASLIDAADTVYTNGRIYTVNEAQPWAEAVAIKDGKFLVVGPIADVEAVTADGTEVVDLGGKFVMPGIHDAHIHPGDVYKHEEAGNLVFPTSHDADQIAAALREFAAANPDLEGIRAEKYDLGAFPGGKLTKDFLDEVISDRPVIVYDSGLHNAGVNSKTLEIAGITKETPDPPLGTIDRDPKTGEPTGYLSETGIGLVGQHIDRVDRAALKRATMRSLREMTAWGITSFIDMMAFEDVFEIYRELESEGKLPFRIVAALAMNEYTDEVVTADEANALIPKIGEYATDRIQTNHFKYWADGTALSFTALLVEPYSNDPSTRGEMTMTPEMKAHAVELMGMGLGGHFHATGDGTVREVLNMIEKAQNRYPGRVRRVHIGHNHIVHPDDIPRYKELGVVAEFSPPVWFPQSFTPLIPKYIGERSERWVPMKEFLAAGVSVAYGSDWPAGTPTGSPWRSLEGMVTREDPWDEYPGRLGEPISLEDAVKMMTLGGAVVMEQENEHGSIEKGKYADMIVLDRNLFETAVKEIDKTTVLRTVFAGEVVYEND